MRDIHTIAAYFLYKAPMCHKKLQKLCYYAQVWHLTTYGTPLMPNRFEAWVHGPVSPDLYVTYKPWGWTTIPRHPIPPALSVPEQQFLDHIFEVYGRYTAEELERLTCRELPYRKARSGCG